MLDPEHPSMAQSLNNSAASMMKQVRAARVSPSALPGCVPQRLVFFCAWHPHSVPLVGWSAGYMLRG